MRKSGARMGGDMQAFLSNQTLVIATSIPSAVLLVVALVYSYLRTHPRIPLPILQPPTVPFAGEEGGISCTPGAPPSQACLSSQNDAQTKRNAVLTLCNTVRATRGKRDALAAAAAAAFTVFLGLFAGAVAAASNIFTAILGAILFIAAAAAFGVAVGFTISASVWNDRLNAAEAALAQAIDNFNTAGTLVRIECCPDTIKVNLDTLTCGSM
jgi:hypothetical protein